MPRCSAGARQTYRFFDFFFDFLSAFLDFFADFLDFLSVFFDFFADFLSAFFGFLPLAIGRSFGWVNPRPVLEADSQMSSAHRDRPEQGRRAQPVTGAHSSRHAGRDQAAAPARYSTTTTSRRSSSGSP